MLTYVDLGGSLSQNQPMKRCAGHRPDGVGNAALEVNLLD